MVARGKTLHDDEKVIRRRKKKLWSICYFFEEQPDTLWMFKVRAETRELAWEESLRKLKREGKDTSARLKYMSCPDD